MNHKIFFIFLYKLPLFYLFFSYFMKMNVVIIVTNFSLIRMIGSLFPNAEMSAKRTGELIYWRFRVLSNLKLFENGPKRRATKLTTIWVYGLEFLISVNFDFHSSGWSLLRLHVVK